MLSGPSLPRPRGRGAEFSRIYGSVSSGSESEIAFKLKVKLHTHSTTRSSIKLDLFEMK